MVKKERCIACGRKLKFANGFNSLPLIKDVLFVFEEMNIDYPEELNEVEIFIDEERLESAIEMDEVILKHGEPQYYNADFYRKNYPDFYYGYDSTHYIQPINLRGEILSNAIGYSNIYGHYAHEDYIKELLGRYYCCLPCFQRHLKITHNQAKKHLYKQKKPQKHFSNINQYDIYEELPMAKIRKILIEEYGQCKVCGDNRVIEVHHIIAREYGGKDTLSNVVPLCPTCHNLSHGKGVIKNG